MIRITAAAMLVAALAVASPAQPPSPPVEAGPSAEPGPSGLKPLRAPDGLSRSHVNLRVSFTLRERGLESSGSFLVESGTQANFVLGSDEPWETESPQGKGIEFKKHGAIVNVLPSISQEKDRVDAQWQSELSGPLAPKTSLKVPTLATFQFQTEFSARLGRSVVLVDGPGRRIEVKIEVER